MLRSIGLDPGCIGGPLSPTPVFCNTVIHQTGASPGLPGNLKPLGWRKELLYEGLFCHQTQDALTAGPEEMASPLPEQELECVCVCVGGAVILKTRS